MRRVRLLTTLVLLFYGCSWINSLVISHLVTPSYYAEHQLDKGLLFYGYSWIKRLVTPSNKTRIPTGLEYDGTREFRIANRRVTIETRSMSLGNGDDGDAEIIVSYRGESTKLHSKFSADNWTFIQPAYISWEDVDEHSGRDLLIWKPSFSTQGPLKANEFISSKDGELHTLQVPLKRPIPRQ